MSGEIMTTYLEKHKKLCAEATPGEWVTFLDTVQQSINKNGPPWRICALPKSRKQKKDAHFIASSRTAMPKLIEAVEFAKDKLETIAQEPQSIDPKFMSHAYALGALNGLEKILND